MEFIKQLWLVYVLQNQSYDLRMVSIKNDSHPKTYDRYDPAFGLHKI
ncbi:hypothetical protein [Escherichia phage EP75]|nr:hypothetical protein HYP60_gp209 [Escherichia phage EP75]AVZ45047.1 hypothetical protein [Escherichia phage EP75]